MSTVEIADDYNIQETWNRACQAFARMTQADLTSSPKLSVDQVLDEIQRRQDDEDEKHNKYRAAKDAIRKTGDFLLVLGGIAAQGASMVFAPSSLCFNAISYLIETGAKYKRIFSSLAELFRRILDVLERCKIYMRLPAEAVDISLRKIINEELVCFVDICALSIKVMKGNKILTALKVFAFDSDEGVNGQLGRLASLVERESQMRATLGFESQKNSEMVIAETRDGTRKVASSVDKLLSSERKKDADNVAERLLSGIDNNLDTPSETFKNILATYKQYLSEQVSGTGQWFQSDILYTSWVDSPRSKCSILGVSGDQGTGKSFLFANIVKCLQEAYSERAEDMTRTSVAYYIFDQGDDGSSLIKALKALAWQIAKADMVYRKELSSIQTTGINQIGSLCDVLFGKSYKADSTFFLLFDGIDRMGKQHLKELLRVLGEWQTKSADWSRFTLRIFLTGRTEIMNRVNDELGDGISVIDMASKNRDDILKFINNRMDKMDILSSSSEQVKSLRGEILEALAKPSSDFVNIGLLLDEISSKQRPGEVRDILSRSGENRSDTIVRKIDALNEALSDEDISDLNELLTWVMFAIRSLSVAELEAVLVLKSHEPSLRPLIEKLRDQYSSLFHIAAAKVHLSSESIAEFLRQSSAPSDHDQIVNDTGDVNETELKGKTIRVAVDPETADLKMTSACLEVICSYERPDLDPLLHYAIHSFGRHLELVDPSLTLPQHKIALGPQLVKVFIDERVIERWWTDSTPSLRRYWIYQDEEAEVVLKWLQDSAVIKDIPEEHKEWIKSLSSKSQLDADLFEHVGRFVARNWLQVGPPGILDVFDVLHGYVTKIKHRKDPSIALFEILETADWAQKQIGLEQLGYNESRNLARTLRDFGKNKEAIDQFKHTSTLAKENWLSQYGLAACYAVQGDFSTAIDIVEATSKAIRNGEFGKSEEAEGYLVDMSDDLATWNKRIGRNEVALAIYQEQLNVDIYDHYAAGNLIILLHQQARYTDLLELQQSLKNTTDEASGLNLWIKNIHEHSTNDTYHEAIFALAQDDSEFHVVFETYEEALDAAKARLLKERKAGNTSEEWFALSDQVQIMIRIATLCQRHSTGHPTREKCAIDHWLHIMEMDASYDPWLLSIQAEVRSQFALFCYEKAWLYPDTAADYLKHLEHITSSKKSDDGIWLLTSHPSRLLARYHALQGNLDKVKSILRFNVKYNLDLLSDDDPLNDWQAYRDLAVHFMFAEQYSDALAAWSLICPTSNNTDEAVEAVEANTEKNDDERLKGPRMHCGCSGSCGTLWTFADNFYVCKACDYSLFDKECLDKLRDGTLKRNTCNSEHEMLHVPAYDPAEHKRVGNGNIKVGEEVMTVEEWLRRVRRHWGLDLG
ncbi:hypothetical protein BJY01DRAFT_257114 [Aspergillus pseudoustus]|uniref:Fungal STAND N-terminal Goodbye domain-containing protein n=1 Tax=Aspergillus pseudoustus TaxID=1810923 RepID=A0ABR4JMJ1_9EURO